MRTPSRGLAVVSLAALLVGLTAGPVAARPEPFRTSATGPFVDGRVLVAFQPGTSAADRRSERSLVRGRTVRAFSGGVELLEVPAGAVAETVGALRGRARIRLAEPDYVMSEDAATIPNDPSFGLQWALRNTGQAVNGVTGTAGADERATTAWSVGTGSSSVVVAVTDSGVQYTHPDLAANIWTNPGGVGGCAAGTHGYNVLNGVCDPMDDEVTYGGHGTHVAGIIGAVGNNGIGTSGVNWTTSILPVKWLNSAGDGSTSGLIAALDWVLQVQHAGVNVRVVNDSATFVGTAYSQALSDEIDLLGQNDILFVTAAGNTGDNNDNPAVRRYPCGYDRPTEICVTASNQRDVLPSWANYGAMTVDLAAPGDNIVSTLRNSTYGTISGGSMASPQVAGTAALILSTGFLSATALKARILDNVDPVPALNGLVRTGGRLDICQALPGCGGPPPPPPPAPVNTVPPAISGTAQVGQTLTATTGTWQNGPTGYAFQWLRCSAGSCPPIASATTSTYVAASADVGATLEISVSATNGGGTTTATSAPTAAVQPASQGPQTFGTTTVGSGSDPMLADRKRVNRASLPVAGSVSKLSVYLQSTATSGSQTIRGVLYADSAGKPAGLLGVTNPLTFASGQSAGWYDLSFPTPVALSAGNYWIGMISASTSYVAAFRYSTVSASRAYNVNTYGSGPANPFGSVTVDSELMSVYATYTPG